MAVTYLDPRAEVGPAPEPYDLRTDLAPGTVVGLMANGFFDSVAFLDAMEQALHEVRPDLPVVRFDKGNASSPATPVLLDEVARQCGAVIAAWGH